VVNSYFNILIRYGDQHEVLGFRDLIEVKAQSETDLDVELRNPEYDITQSIKKVLYAYQGSGELFDNINHPVVFKGYISAKERLPDFLRTLREELENLLADLAKRSNGKLSYQNQDPDENGGALAKQLESEFGFRPMTASMFDTNGFWFYMTLQGDGRIIQVPLPENFEKAELERGIEAALKRFSRGFLKTVAMHTPSPAPTMPQFGMSGGKRFDWLRDSLAEEHNIAVAELQSGQVPDETDLLLLVSPDKLDQKQLFAVDQFLMQGGTVVLATSPFDIDSEGALLVKEHESGIEDWLAHHGISLEKTLVLDPQNAAFPIPVNRQVGGFVIRETQLVDYPYFVDIRDSGMALEGGITSGLNQVTLTWPSPLSIDQDKNKARQVTPLLQSTDGAWTSGDLNIQPDFRAHGPLGFPVGGKRSKQLLAVAVEGRFDSFFQDKPSPLAVEEPADEAQGQETEEADAQQAQPVVDRLIKRSPESARIILFASNTFLSDEMLNLATSGLRTRYLKPVELIENAIDWSLEDRGLLAIRGRAHFSRTLEPLDREGQVFWEYLNYAMALVGLFLVWIIRRQINRKTASRYAAILAMAARAEA
jgi:ABC-2 type transport system permease protein